MAFAQKGLKKLNKVKFNAATGAKVKEGGEEKVKEAFVNKTLKVKRRIEWSYGIYNPAAVEAEGDWWGQRLLPCKCEKGPP